MRYLPIILLFILCNGCAQEPDVPTEADAEVYYLVVRFDQEEDATNLKNAIAAQLEPYGRFRTSNLVLGSNQEERTLTIRRFTSLQEGNKLLKVMREEPLFQRRDMRVVSQTEYREMLKQKSFYAHQERRTPLNG